MKDKQYTIEQMTKVVALALQAKSFLVFSNESRFFLSDMRVVSIDHDDIASDNFIDKLKVMIEKR